MISAVVLAAGMSTRMGQPKPLVRVGGRPLLQHVLDSVRRSRVDEIVVVLGHEADRVHRELAFDGVTLVVNPNYTEGMSSSIRVGLRAADERADAYLVVLADQPFVAPSTLDALVDRKAGSTAKILIPTFRGVRGNPVLVDRSLSRELHGISGDQGCRAVFEDHLGELLEVPVDDAGVLLDLDTEDQLERVDDALAHGIPLETIVSLASPPPVHLHPRGSHAPRPRVRPSIDVLALAQDLRGQNEPFALATVVRAVRPTSGKPGYKAIVRPDRAIAGWVGGSCAESVVVAESLVAMRDGRPRIVRLSRDPGRGTAPEGIVEYMMECHSGGAMDIYIEPHLPKPRLLIVGDSPVVDALSSLGRVLGYHVVVAAPEASAEAFPDADQVVGDLGTLRDHVTAETYIVVASMGKYDETAIAALAASPARYVGLVASRARAAVLLDSVHRRGVPAEAVDRVRNPAGVDIAAKTPPEIALSIMAEITSVRNAARVESAGMNTPVRATALSVDVVCGMEVDPNTPLRVTHEGTTFYFCSEGCRSRFAATPDAFLA